MEDNKDEMELRIKKWRPYHLDKINKEDLTDVNKGGSGDVNKDGFVTEGDSKQILILCVEL